MNKRDVARLHKLYVTLKDKHWLAKHRYFDCKQAGNESGAKLHREVSAVYNEAANLVWDIFKDPNVDPTKGETVRALCAACGTVARWSPKPARHRQHADPISLVCGDCGAEKDRRVLVPIRR